jgi:uncharacterized protein
MDLKGEFRLPARRDAVWAALNDPAVLGACIPGCERLEKTADGVMATTVGLRVGVFKLRLNGEIRLENVTAPERYTIVGEGKGGIAGFARGSADVRLVEDGAETVVAYTVLDTELGGRIAQFGGRLVEATVVKLATRFFDRFVAHLDGEAIAGDAGKA